MFKKVRYYIFLRDVMILAITAFGGPQAHLAMMLDLMVKKRGYLNESELIELNALCQILPGPSSTQTITAIGFKVGGPNLAYLTLLIWIVPAFLIMTTAGIAISYFGAQGVSLSFTRYIQPMAVGIVAYSAYVIIKKVVKTRVAFVLMVVSAVVSFLARSPFAFPIILIIGGTITAFNYKKEHKEDRKSLNINWSNFILWLSVFAGAAIIGGITQSLPVRIFENFYRNGSLIFGGGQVLVPLLYTEFVEFKEYLTSEEFLSGFALVQSVPGPVFSFSAFVGAISMHESGIAGQILGAALAAIGIFLPGTFLIFFIIRFWAELKKFRIIKASLDGITATSSGMVLAAAYILSIPLHGDWINYVLIISTFLILLFTKIPSPVLIGIGLVLGILI